MREKKVAKDWRQASKPAPVGNSALLNTNFIVQKLFMQYMVCEYILSGEEEN